MDITIFILLLAFSAFFSSSETAFLSLDKIRIKQLENSKKKSVKRTLKLLNNPHELLITILIGNTLVNIAASAFFGDICYSYFGEKGIIFSMFLMTIILLIFGEVTPKKFALLNPEKVSSSNSFLLSFLKIIFSPVRKVLENFSRPFLRGLGIKSNIKHSHITEQEMRSIFSFSKKRGIVKDKEKDMIDSILEFKELNVADVMSPRIDVKALDINLSPDQIIKEIKDHKYSRLPVYVHTLDNIVGILHSKDFLINPNIPIKNIIDKPFYAPESMKIDDLLSTLQKKKNHMAIVTDEYGVTSGVITLEDILEEIVGEIHDEFDFDEMPNIVKIDKKTYEIEGQTHIDEVNEILGLNIVTDEVDTIGGYIILMKGKIPHSGDVLEEENYIITVNDVSKNRITSITVEKK